MTHPIPSRATAEAFSKVPDVRPGPMGQVASTPALRRRALLIAAVPPLLAPLAMTVTPRSAHAAASAVPSALNELDRAAVALLDAGETGQWMAAGQALARARKAAHSVAPLESAFVEAGGELRHFFQARNDLVADLIEAKTALSVKDRRWMSSAAVQIAARAGELSQPFSARSGALLPQVESLLYLARRMRRALVWRDDIGFRSAQDDFKRLWSALKGELASAPPDRVRVLDDALVSISSSTSTADIRRLYAAVQQLRDFAGGR